MALADRLRASSSVFLDTAPVIYYVEEHPKYLPMLDTAFDVFDTTDASVVTSPITIAECLVGPLRAGDPALRNAFVDLLVGLASIALPDVATAKEAASLRAEYNLSLLDAFQIALAKKAGCAAFLTNDAMLRRVAGVDVILLDEFLSTTPD